mmetsp:Transcript_19451/g.61027  ORF Transcript_19451/g.61027 Transcript_19451/m.61027 type:complete len:209 (+) Transcript_19451:8-634(+)
MPPGPGGRSSRLLPSARPGPSPGLLQARLQAEKAQAETSQSCSGGPEPPRRSRTERLLARRALSCPSSSARRLRQAVASRCAPACSAACSRSSASRLAWRPARRPMAWVRSSLACAACRCCCSNSAWSCCCRCSQNASCCCCFSRAPVCSSSKLPTILRSSARKTSQLTFPGISYSHAPLRLRKPLGACRRPGQARRPTRRARLARRS